MTAPLAGSAAGFMVSTQLGPLSLFLIRSTLRGTLAVGLAIGAGSAIVGFGELLAWRTLREGS